MPDQQTTAITERVKDWYERISKFSLYPITNYIRSAGYYTKIHFHNMHWFGIDSGFRIIGSKDRAGLRYRGYSDEVPPEVLISISKMDFLASSADFEIICPPDPKLNGLEDIVLHTFKDLFSKAKPAEAASTPAA